LYHKTTPQTTNQMKTLVNANVNPTSRLEKSILKEKLLIKIKSMRDKAIVARDIKEEIRLNSEYERVLTSSGIEDGTANAKTPVTARQPQNKPAPDDKKKDTEKDTKKEDKDKKFKYLDNPDNNDDDEWAKSSFFNRLAVLINLKNK